MGKRTGRPVGRPPKFTSKEQIQELGEAYLRECMGKPFIMDDGSVLRDKYGEVILLGRHPPTVTGLARALGFTSRQSLLEYQAKAEFADTVTRLKMQIEEYAEERLFDKDGQRGAEFSLKYNFRWAQEAEKDGSEDENNQGVVLIPEVGALNE